MNLKSQPPNPQYESSIADDKRPPLCCMGPFKHVSNWAKSRSAPPVQFEDEGATDAGLCQKMRMMMILHP